MRSPHHSCPAIAADTYDAHSWTVEKVAHLQHENAQLRADCQLAELIFAAARVGTWDWPDITQESAIWSDSFLALLGYQRGELEPKVGVFRELLHPDDVERIFGELGSRIAEGGRHSSQYRVRCRSGEYRWFESCSTVLCDAEGKPIRMVGSFQDVHERKVAEDELAKFNLRHQLSLQASGIGIWDWDMVKDHLVWDLQMYALYGADPGQFSSAYDAWEKSLHPEDRAHALDVLQQALSGEAAFDTEFRIVRPDGAVRHIRGIAAIMRDGDGSPVRMVGANWDVTSQRLTELELRQSNLDLAHFAHVASHDLKTPLRGVSTAVSWVREDLEAGTLEEIPAHLDLVVDRLQRMDALIDGLLQYARAEDKGGSERVCLKSVVDDVQEDIVGNYGGFLLRTAGELVCLQANPVLLRQVVGNLVENAIKHHDQAQGTVVLEVTPVAGHVQIAVSDDGPGIPLQYREQIFEAFRTLKSRDAGGGSGLGLALVKKIVERHGGVIEVTDNAPRGTCFTFTWPIALERSDALLG